MYLFVYWNGSPAPVVHAAYQTHAGALFAAVMASLFLGLQTAVGVEANGDQATEYATRVRPHAK